MLTITPPLQRTPQRIVSLLPSLTESLFTFGLGRHIVGITDYCVEPQPQVGTKSTIGGTKNPDVEAILRLALDLVVANVEENSREDVEFIQARGISVFVCFPQTVVDAIATFWALAEATGAKEQAAPVLARVESAYEENKALTAGAPKSSRLLPYLEKSVDDDQP
jgi:ABC-type Fe3+-hydroxamate transport system substrate-binding protein